MSNAETAPSPGAAPKGYTGEIEFVKDVMGDPNAPQVLVHYWHMIFRDGLLVEVKPSHGKTDKVGASPRR